MSEEKMECEVCHESKKSTKCYQDRDTHFWMCDECKQRSESSIKEKEGLPTAAEVEIDEEGLKFPRPSIELYSELEEGDELVRRTDVAQLIRERIEEEKINCVTRTGQHAYALEILEELLEEVETEK